MLVIAGIVLQLKPMIFMLEIHLHSNLTNQLSPLKMYYSSAYMDSGESSSFYCFLAGSE